MAASGTVTFSTALDNSQLERDLRDAEKAVDKLEQKLSEKTAERSAIEQEMEDAKKAVEATKRRVDELKASVDALNASKPAEASALPAWNTSLKEANQRYASANEILAEQYRELTGITERWNKAGDDVDAYRSKLDGARARQAELGAEYARSYSRGAEAATRGLSAVEGRVEKFAGRVTKTMRKVFIFSAITGAVRALKSALSGTLSENARLQASFGELQAVLNGFAAFAAQAVAPAIIAVVNAATAALLTLARLVDSVFGTSIEAAIQRAREAASAQGAVAAKAAKQERATRKLAKATKEANRQLASFDELNILAAESSDDAGDAIEDSVPEVADAEPAQPDWSAFDVGKIDSTLSAIMAIIGGALIAVGAILCFSGINIPLGLTLMAIGALMVYTAYQENWSALPQQVRDAITGALVLAGLVLFVLGVVLAFAGPATMPLGIGMMAAGAALLWTAVALNWADMPERIRGIVSGLMVALSLALLVIGAILCFSGGGTPLGVALMAAGAVSLAAIVALNWDTMPAKVRQVVTLIAGIVGVALLVLGAILTFTMANPFLGVGLLIAGAVTLAAAAALNWSKLSKEVQRVVTYIAGIVGVAFLVIGSVLAFSGANLPLGIAILLIGAAAMATAVGLNWDLIQDHMDVAIALLEAALAVAFLAVGAILAVSGANLPLGIALLAIGALEMARTVMVNWDLLPAQIRSVVAVLAAIVGAALLVVGAILAFSGANIPLGVMLLAAGAVSLGAAYANWDSMPAAVRVAVVAVESVLGLALLGLGAVLAFSGANIPLGIGLMAIGALAMAHAMLNWGELPQDVRNVVTIVTAIMSAAMLALGAILAFSGANIPLGVGLMMVGALSLAATLWLNWAELPQDIRNTVSTIMAIVGGALIVLGIILCATGVGIPLGVALILAGAGSLAGAIALNWDAILWTIRNVWAAIVSWFWSNVGRIFTWQWWYDRFKSIVNGLIGALNGGLSAVEWFVNSVMSGFSNILSWVGAGSWSWHMEMPRLPYLAQGAVIPPNKEFLAVLGDQRRGTNIETPEELMRQVVREEAETVMADAVRIMAGQSAGGGDVTLVLTVDGRELARAVNRGGASLARCGDMSFAMDIV